MPAGIDRKDVNPRPLSPDVPSTGTFVNGERVEEKPRADGGAIH